MSEPEVRITLRLPESLRDRLTAVSELNKRSMNGEIVDRLDYTFDRVDAEMVEFRQKGIDRLEAELQERREQLAAALAENERLRYQLEGAEQRADRHSEEIDHMSKMLNRQLEWRSSAQKLTLLVDITGLSEPWSKALEILGKLSDNVQDRPWGVEAVLFDLSNIDEIRNSDYREYLLALIAKYALDGETPGLTAADAAAAPAAEPNPQKSNVKRSQRRVTVPKAARK